MIWQWLAANWGLLLAGIVCAGYFALYVLAMRHQANAKAANGAKLPCDRC